jgi:plastocyanin domain-containing protein
MREKIAFVKPLETKARDSVECISMYSKYISTHLDVKYDNFKKSIENKNYIENECWINTLMDYYGETILSPDRALRYRITRETLKYS